MSRRFMLAVAPVLVVAAFAVAPAVGQASSLKWFNVTGGVLSQITNSTNRNVASVGDHFRLFGLNDQITSDCLVFNGGTITQPGVGGNGSDSLTVFAAITPPCPAGGALGSGCTTVFSILTQASPAFKGNNPFPSTLVQLTGKRVDRIDHPTFIITFNGTCLAAGTSSAFAATNLLAFVGDNAAPPANSSKECNNATVPNTGLLTITSVSQALGGSGTLVGTQGTTGTSGLSGTVAVWTVPSAVTLTSAAQPCTGLAALLTVG